MLRHKTELEQERFRSYFQNLNVSRSIVTGEPSTRYNSLAWSMGFKDRWLWPAGGIEHFDAFFTSFGYERTRKGTIAVWGHSLDQITHVSVFVPDTMRWESKCGGDLRIQHALEELYGNVYGRPIAWYTKVPTASSTFKKEATEPCSWELSQNEQALLREKALLVPRKKVIEFEKLFEDWRNTWFSGLYTINSDPASRMTSYEFFRLVKMGDVILPLVVLKLTEQENFMALVLYEKLQKDQKMIVANNISDPSFLEGEQVRAFRTVKAYLNQETLSDCLVSGT